MNLPGHSDGQTGDAGLVAKALKRDGEAWAKLVQKHSRFVSEVIRSHRVPEGDQADAFQHVFVELYKALPTLLQTDNLAPWLRQTTRRHAVYLRTKLEKVQTGSETFDAIPDSCMGSAEGDLLEAEQGLEVQEAILALSERCRKLVQMLFYEDPPRPYAEVAKELGIQTPSLGMTRQRCLDALQKEFKARGIP